MKIIRVNDDNFRSSLDIMKKHIIWGFDVETNNMMHSKALVSVISVHVPEEPDSISFLIPIRVLDSSLSWRNISEFISVYSRAHIVGHNLVYDVSAMLRTFGVLPGKIKDDTMTLALMRQSKETALKSLAVIAKPSLAKTLVSFKDIAEVDEERDSALLYSFTDKDQVIYMALDSYLPFIVREYLYRDELEVAYRAELDIIIPLAIQQTHGLQVDYEKYNRISKEIEEDLTSKQAILNGMAGYEIKANSPAQVQRLLFEEMGLPETPIKTKTGKCSTSEESLSYLKGEPIVDAILDVKGLISRNSTASKALDYADENHRIHPQMLPIGFDGTARIYSTKPSLNQWPWELRGCIVPDPGKKFIYADWKSAELMIAAHLAGQTELIEQYNNGADVHSFMASRLLGISNPDKQQREVSKTLTFATMYGSEGAAVARSLKCSESEAQLLVQNYLTLLYKVKELRDETHKEALRTFKTKTILGRPRVLTNLYDSTTIEKGKRQSFNTKIQGSCADLQKIAIARLYERYKDTVSFKFTVFDSFLLEVDESFTDEEAIEVLNYMSDFTHIYPGLKLRYAFAMGYDWRSAKEMAEEKPL